MSYAVYLRNKMASQPTVLDTNKPTDASMITQKIRLAASQDFPVNGAGLGTTLQSSDMSYSGLNHAVTSNVKKTGRPGPASSFTAYRGSQAIGTDAAYKRGYIVNPTTMTTTQCALVNNPAKPPQSSSDFLRQTQGCKVALGEQHEPNTVGPRIFVDNTIRNQGDPGLCTTRPANHSSPANTPHIVYSPRPSEGGGQLAIKGNLAPGKDVPYKVGAALRKIPYVEKHHGNGFTVNPRRPFVRYQIPKGTPAHLKINDPQAPRMF